MVAGVVKREWKPVEGFENYEVSNFGEVWSWLTKKQLRPGPTTAGYLTVNLRRGAGRSRTRYVHDLVARAFIPNPKNKRTVNHQKLPLANNKVTNLEWMTHGENHKHAYACLGRKHSGRKRVANSDGREFESVRAASQWAGVTLSAVAVAARTGTICCRLAWWFV